MGCSCYGNNGYNQLYGWNPCNFLDVGGKANAETVAKGFEIILIQCKGYFCNIFGGIVRCDRIAMVS